MGLTFPLQPHLVSHSCGRCWDSAGFHNTFQLRGTASQRLAACIQSHIRKSVCCDLSYSNTFVGIEILLIFASLSTFYNISISNTTSIEHNISLDLHVLQRPVCQSLDSRMTLLYRSGIVRSWSLVEEVHWGLGKCCWKGGGHVDLLIFPSLPGHRMNGFVLPNAF